jgi:hypothetical protein
MTPLDEIILDDLTHLPIWVAWREEQRNGDATKVPYNPRTGREAKSTDSATWATRGEAETWAIINRGGVGIVLSPINGGDCCLCGIDLDTCRDPNTETFQDWAQEVIDRFSTYTEVSPSRTGAKLLFTHAAADIPAVERLFNGHGGRQFKNGGGKHCPAIEIYRTGRYFTVTDESIGPTDILRQASTADLEWLIRDAGPKLAHKERQKSGSGNDHSRSGKAFCKGAALKTAGHSYDAMRDALLAGEDPEIADWARTKGLANGERELHRIYEKAGAADVSEGVSLDDFNAYMPMHSYIFTPAREMWPAASVNARISPVSLFDRNRQPALDKDGKQKTMPANMWLDKNKSVEQMTWAPGKPMLIMGKLIADGGWIDREGVSCFNLYRPPVEGPGDPKLAGPWIDHINRVYPDDAGHIINWLAQRVERPHEKINHALVLGGLQGVGKDTLLEPVKAAIGAWNFAEVSPKQMLGRFNGYLKSVILRVSEARDLGDVDRFQFYDHLKAYTAAPPDVLRVDEKNLREHAILNCTGVIITTNHKTDGIYLPADDRRHYVAWSDLSKEDFDDGYWNALWNWYAREGSGHVAAFLRDLDISEFDPKAPPPKTQAFWDIADANRAPEDAELSDVIDGLGNPDAFTLTALKSKAAGTPIYDWLDDRKNRRAIPHRLEACEYVPVRNDAANDGLWKINERRQAIYARQKLSIRDRLAAASELAGGG